VLRVALLLGSVIAAIPAAGLNDRLGPSVNHPAIQYWAGTLTDPASVLNTKLQSGDARLQFEGPTGYLRSLLDALHVPIESQIAVFSKNSLQASRIEPRNPRTIFFNDSVAVGWMYGGFIEVASHDPRKGVIFYVLTQAQTSRPVLQRRSDCQRCHLSDASLGVPGMMVRSMFTAPDGTPQLIFGSSLVDHRTPFEDRWGGYYVTGASGAVRHKGNAMVTNDGDPRSMVTPATLKLTSLESKFDTGHYLSPYSDAGALMVFDHQMHMQNLITRVGWEIRAAQYDAQQNRSVDISALLRETAEELVDYLLFVDEAPLSAPMAVASEFATKFAAEGPCDRKGRSLRDLDLQHRLLRYPCSYMIYSEAFDALPPEAKAAIYERMWQVLSGGIQEKKYARLSLADRRAIVEILRDTKRDLPDYFRTTQVVIER
jgi:hypothetical protein